MRHVFLAGVLGFGALAVASCGGGGGSSPSPSGGGGGGGGATPTPAPTPVGQKYTLPSPSPIVQSVYSIDSQPHGLVVKVDGTQLATTPATTSPAYANTPHVITVIPTTTASPFAVTVTQTSNGSHTIFYNSQSDTLGKLAALTPASVTRRHPAAIRRATSIARIHSNLTGRPLYSDHRLAVTYDVGALGGRTVAALESRHGVASAATVAQSGSTITRAVTIAAGQSLDAVRAGLAAEPGVRSVDRVGLRYPLGEVYPDDPFFNASVQWDLYQINCPGGWGFGLGQPSIAVAVIDTGYDPNQPDLAPKVTYSEKVLAGAIDTASGAATDTNGHGTVISGITSALTNNGEGYAGVGYGVSLQEYKIYGDGQTSSDTADESEAIREAVAHGAKVILLASGGSSSAGPDPFEHDAVAFALSSGVAVIAASGDEGTANTIDYPAAYSGVIAVGASALNDSAFPGDAGAATEYVATYSNSGPGLTMVAPGGEPTGTSDTDQIHWIENLYTTQPWPGTPACAAGSGPTCGARFDGTSMAAAHVAGAAGLILSQTTLSPAALSTLLSSTADDIADPNEAAGRLDVARAMASATNSAPLVPYVPAYNQFVAFAYSNIGVMATKPTIMDVTYPQGVPVSSTGTFRIADLPAPSSGTGTTSTYRIAVWYDTNGNGVIDAGDYIGTSGVCAKSGACSASISVAPVAAGYVLP
jgi:hypothetical protein